METKEKKIVAPNPRRKLLSFKEYVRYVYEPNKATGTQADPGKIAR
jgi:hypothetical protein